MKKINIVFLALIALLINSCTEDFETFPNNPNVASEASSVPPEYLLRQILTDIRAGADGTETPFSLSSRLNQMTTGLTFPLYGGSNLYNWTQGADTYGWIRNITKLEENAKRAIGTDKNPYLTIAKFLRVYSSIWFTEQVGDIPVFEAGKGLENPQPKFDKQEDIYKFALKTLDDLNKELGALASDATTPKMTGDIYYNNDLSKWRRAINAYTLRLLISLSKRVDDTPSLEVKQKFSKIVSNPNEYPLFRDITDNFNFVFLPITNRYPTQFLRLYSLETTVSKTIIDILKENQDPRIFVFATPTPESVKNDKKLDDFTAYEGSDNARDQGALFAEANLGKYSYINYERYLKGPDNIPEPYTIIGYQEMCFNIAEAANRGWINANAEEWYMKGIQASLKFYGISNGTKLPISKPVAGLQGEVTSNTTQFLENVKYKGNNAQGLEQILKQKFVAFWQNSGWQPFYQYRRTGIPKFTEGVGTNSQKKIPVRWVYPIKEVINNSANAQEAIQRQFGGKDDVFMPIWLIK